MSQLSDVEQVALAVVLELSPSEKDYFPVATELFRRNPDRRPRADDVDAELGIGVDLGSALSAVALWVTSEVFQYAMGLAAGGALDRTRGLRERIAAVLRRIPLIRRLLPRVDAVDIHLVSTLSPVQLRLVRDVARDRAVKTGLPPQQADNLADSIISRLVTAPTAT